MTTETKMEMAYKLESAKPVDDIVAGIEQLAPDHKFRVLHVHDVQATLKEKGFERGPLKIVEICSAPFADQALKMNVDVAMFMPCRYTVYEEDGKTKVTLARPMMIAQMMPGIGLEPLAEQVEETLKQIMHEVS